MVNCRLKYSDGEDDGTLDLCCCLPVVLAALSSTFIFPAMAKAAAYMRAWKDSTSPLALSRTCRTKLTSLWALTMSTYRPCSLSLGVPQHVFGNYKGEDERECCES